MMFVVLLALALMNLLAQGPIASAPDSVSGGRVSGVVVVEGTDSPIGRAIVALMPSPARGGGGAIPNRLLTTATGRDGRFTFEDVPAGEYYINVDKAGFTEMTPQSVTLEAGGQRTDLTVTLQRGVAIAGRVLDDSGEPIANATVMAMKRIPASPDAKDQLPSLVPDGPSAQTNDLGEFRLFGLQPGAYTLQVAGREMFGIETGRQSAPVPTYYPGTADPLSAKMIALDAGETFSDAVIRVVELPAFRVSGVVVDRDGQPVGNALVRLTSTEASRAPTLILDGLHQRYTNAAGRFTIPSVTAGRYTLTAIAPVVTSPANSGTATGPSSASLSFGLSAVTGGTSGAAGNSESITSETHGDGSTSEWRETLATKTPVTISDADATGLNIVVQTR